MPTGQTKHLTEAQESDIAQLYADENKAINWLVGEYHISPTRINTILAAHGVQKRGPGKAGRLWAEAQPKKRRRSPDLNYNQTADRDKKPPVQRKVADVTCGWDGVENVRIRVARGERTCTGCGDAVVGQSCHTPGCKGGELVDTVTALGLRDGEWTWI